MKAENDKELSKRQYKKPRLRIIELAADEVLAANCKIVDPNQFNPGFPACGIAQGCAGPGT